MANEDDAYRAWVTRQPCAMCGKAPPSQCHHRTGAGLALRAHDHQSMPLCPLCHHDLHALSGRFKGWSRGQLRLWQEDKVNETRARYLRLQRLQGELSADKPEDGEVF